MGHLKKKIKVKKCLTLSTNCMTSINSTISLKSALKMKIQQTAVFGTELFRLTRPKSETELISNDLDCSA